MVYATKNIPAYQYLAAGEGRACVEAAAEAGLPFKFASPSEESENASIPAEALD
jgi:hypothetical protein